MKYTQIVATHSNTDFDALASLVAATFLYPDSVAVLPTHIKPNVKEFLAIHRDLFRLVSPVELDLAQVKSLIVVDVNHWSRLERTAELRGKEGLEVILWDHHMQGGNIEPSWKCQEEAGATITLMMREMEKRDCAFAPMHATLFLMGLYDDTGNLTYPCVTAEDARTAGYLLENGADMNVAAAYLSAAFDMEHTEVLTRMLDTSQIFQLGGFGVGISFLSVESGLTMLSSVVNKYKEIKGLDVAFGVFSVGQDRCMVIGRGAASSIDVGAVMRRLGGGGHPGAGSAMIKEAGPDAAYRMVRELIEAELDRPRLQIKDIMSRIESSIPPSTKVSEARTLLEKVRTSALLVIDNGRLCGIISEAECRKAKTDSQLRAPVKAIMRRDVPRVGTGQGVREALRSMTEADIGLLPVIDNDEVVGVVTRADLILHLYEF